MHSQLLDTVRQNIVDRHLRKNYLQHIIRDQPSTKVMMTPHIGFIPWWTMAVGLISPVAVRLAR